jgi:hypothetical protein
MVMALGKLLELMARQHGVAASHQARACGIDSAAQRRLIDRGVFIRPVAGVLVSSGAPRTWHQRALVATMAPGRSVVSHGAAARLHGLAGFEHHRHVDVLCRKGWWPDPPAGTITHFTRGPRNDAVVEIDSIPVLDVGVTLALLAPVAGVERTIRALDSALGLGHQVDDLRAAALRWQRRGRAGPTTLLRLLDMRC